MGYYSEEYRTLVENAMDAVRELLDESTPDSWMVLRQGYGQIRLALERDDEHDQADALAEAEADAERRRQWLEDDKRRNAWKELPYPEKLHRILNAIGDDRLAARELAERMRTLHPDCNVHESDVQTGLKELLTRGDVERTKETRVPGGTAWRWRYNRRAGITPQLAGLERAYHDENEAA